MSSGRMRASTRRSGFLGTISRIGSRGPITAPTVMTLRSTTSPAIGATIRWRSGVLRRPQALAAGRRSARSSAQLGRGLLAKLVAQRSRAQLELGDLLARARRSASFSPCRDSYSATRAAGRAAASSDDVALREQRLVRRELVLLQLDRVVVGRELLGARRDLLCVSAIWVRRARSGSRARRGARGRARSSRCSSSATRESVLRSQELRREGDAAPRPARRAAARPWRAPHRAACAQVVARVHAHVAQHEQRLARLHAARRRAPGSR